MEVYGCNVEDANVVMVIRTVSRRESHICKAFCASVIVSLQMCDLDTGLEAQLCIDRADC
jgi:hypothetical protein